VRTSRPITGDVVSSRLSVRVCPFPVPAAIHNRPERYDPKKIPYVGSLVGVATFFAFKIRSSSEQLQTLG
jgi:hypothetical protein